MVETLRLWKNQEVIQLNLDCLLGFAAAFVTGMLVIRFAIGLLENGNLKHFAWYCMVLGVIVNLCIWL